MYCDEGIIGGSRRIVYSMERGGHRTPLPVRWRVPFKGTILRRRCDPQARHTLLLVFFCFPCLINIRRGRGTWDVTEELQFCDCLFAFCYSVP